ncbi:MAG TPA: phosphotransferase family protein [Acidimicrobiales bacterium]
MTAGEATIVDTPDGVDREGVTAWLAQRIPSLSPPLTFELIAGGRSNLTFNITDTASGHWVLRRPPLGKVLASAHDMGREHRIIAALGPSPVPVPPVVGLCEDIEVNGSPFYVMDYVAGSVLRTLDEVDSAYDASGCQAISCSLIDTLAAIHAVDVDAVGLGELGKRDDYIARQLHRWYGQFQKGEIGEIPSVDRVHDRLVAAIPPQRESTIVHGDFRLDNCLLSPSGEVAAVLDWEICTLGDPLADLGLLMVYWADPGDSFAALGAGPTTAEGFLRRQEMLDRYTETTGRDASAIGSYVAFGYWKLACILTGVATRYAAGVMGDEDAADEMAKGFIGLVRQLADAAEQSLDEVAP